MPIKSQYFFHSPRKAQIVHVSYGRRRPIPSYALSIQCNAIIFGLYHNINTRVKWKRVSGVLLLYYMINTAHSNRRSTRSTPAYCQRLPHIQQILQSIYNAKHIYIGKLIAMHHGSVRHLDVGLVVACCFIETMRKSNTRADCSDIQ